MDWRIPTRTLDLEHKGNFFWIKFGQSSALMKSTKRSIEAFAMQVGHSRNQLGLFFLDFMDCSTYCFFTKQPLECNSMIKHFLF